MTNEEIRKNLIDARRNGWWIAGFYWERKYESQEELNNRMKSNPKKRKNDKKI